MRATGTYPGRAACRLGPQQSPAGHDRQEGDVCKPEPRRAGQLKARRPSGHWWNGWTHSAIRLRLPAGSPPRPGENAPGPGQRRHSGRTAASTAMQRRRQPLRQQDQLASWPS